MSRTPSWPCECSAILRFMPGEDGHTAADIRAMLDRLAASGISAIHITAPYHSAGFYPWWGLRPKNFFSVDPRFAASMDEFKAMVDDCHAHGIRVLLFLNFGYADVSSDLWQTACRAQRDNLPLPERDYFLWATSDDQPAPEAREPFRMMGFWCWSEEARHYYWCSWQEGDVCAPQFNWDSPAFRSHAWDMLAYWLESGADGMIFDAVNWYLNCRMSYLRTLTGLAHNYPDVVCIPEGAGGFGDDYGPWIWEAGFDIIEDQPFDSDVHWNGSALRRAITAGAPSLIDAGLRQHRCARQDKVVSWSYMSWDPEWTPRTRLLEIALLMATGHMTELLQTYLHDWPDDLRQGLADLLRMAKDPRMHPSAPRRNLRLPEDVPCYALWCGADRPDPLLCLFNLSDAPLTVQGHTLAPYGFGIFDK